MGPSASMTLRHALQCNHVAHHQSAAALVQAIIRSPGLFAAMTLLLSASTLCAATAVPDFSGVGGGPWGDYEPPLSGPGPVMNKTRTFYMRIGDDTNPILKPPAAQKVREAAAISRTGVNFPTPSNQCTPWSAPYAWRALQMQMLQEKDRATILYVDG